MQKTNQFLRVDEVAALLRVSKAMVYKLCRTGALPALRVGCRIIIPAENLEKFLQQNRQVDTPHNQSVSSDNK